MAKFSVIFTETKTYCAVVDADNEGEARQVFNDEIDFNNDPFAWVVKDENSAPLSILEYKKAKGEIDTIYNDIEIIDVKPAQE